MTASVGCSKLDYADETPG